MHVGHQLLYGRCVSSCSLRSCSVGCCGVGAPVALLASCRSSGSSVMNSSLYVVFSSKFVVPVHSMLSVASSLLSSHHRFCILDCHLLASPLFVSMLSALSRLVHHLFVVECTCPFLVGHAHVSSMDLL